MVKRKYDWDAIKNEYVIGYKKLSESTGLETTTYPTYGDLSAKYGVSEQYIQQRGSKENWTQQREALKRKLEHKDLKKTLSDEYSESAQFDARILNSASRLLAGVEAYFDQYEHIQLCADGNYRFIPPQNRGYTDDEDDDSNNIKNIKPSDLKQLVEVLDKTQTLVRRTLGEPTHTKNEKLLNNSNDSREDVEKMISQRESLTRQRQGIEFQLEEIEKELADS